MSLRPSLLLSLVALTGCIQLGGGDGPRERLHLYTLYPTVPASEEVLVDTGGATIGLGPVELPDYLHRTQVVIRSAPNQYRLASGGRWAEPLEENILRVMAENLARLTAGERIVTFPWRASMAPDYRVRLTIQRFEASAEGVARLAVLWTIDLPGRDAPHIGRFDERAPVKGEETAGVVAAMSGTLGEFSRHLARELQSVMRSTPREKPQAR